jgi:GTP 3',8-cyclase
VVRNEKPRTVYWLDETLYLNITNRCSNNCWFCIRNFKKGVGGFNLKLEQEPSAAAVLEELENEVTLRRWNEIVFCGFGEPTARLDVLLQVTRWIRKRFAGAFMIRLNTNGQGYILNKGRHVSEELKVAGVNKVSVSLNGYDAETYNANCRPEYADAFCHVKFLTLHSYS